MNESIEDELGGCSDEADEQFAPGAVGCCSSNHVQETAWIVLT